MSRIGFLALTVAFLALQGTPAAMALLPPQELQDGWGSATEEIDGALPTPQSCEGGLPCPSLVAGHYNCVRYKVCLPKLGFML